MRLSSAWWMQCGMDGGTRCLMPTLTGCEAARLVQHVHREPFCVVTQCGRFRVGRSGCLCWYAEQGR